MQHESGIKFPISLIVFSLIGNSKEYNPLLLNKVIKNLDLFLKLLRFSKVVDNRQYLESRLKEVRNNLTANEMAIKDFKENNLAYLKSPKLSLEFYRLEKNLRISEEMYLVLKKEYELAKLEEVKTTPVINVLDFAPSPASLHHPSKKMIFIMAILLSFAVFLLTHHLKEYYFPFFKKSTLTPNSN